MYYLHHFKCTVKWTVYILSVLSGIKYILSVVKLSALPISRILFLLFRLKLCPHYT